MKALYFDPILGVSGDMILASLIDLGANKNYLNKKLSFIGDFDMTVTTVNRAGASAKNVSFKIRTKINEHRFIPLLRKSGLPPEIKKSAASIINRIFEAEKKVHNSLHLHLHELADADTLLDVAGALIAIDVFKVDKIYSREVKVGKGFIKTAEGYMPSFNFATAYLLKGFPVEFLPIDEELVTPTGAAILSAVAKPKNDLVFKKIEGIGVGAGAKEIKGYPNLLRVFLGEIDDKTTDECLVIETNIDDMNPQDYEVLLERLYELGALEVFLTPVIMKHSRPGILLKVLCENYDQKIIDAIFDETTTLGLRFGYSKRVKLERNIIKMPSPYGKISVKISKYNKKRRFALEYRELKNIALENGIPIRDLREELTRHVAKVLSE